MSKTAQSTRRVFTGVDSSGAVPIEYRFSHARNGNRHLVVVFANRYATNEYGWANGKLDLLRSNILWIRDLFDGANTYYLCKGMDFSLEQSVAGVISRVMGSLGLSPDQVTMFGSSKGGSAALFYGLKYGFRNIVASVPQFRIGTRVKEGNPEAVRVMMGEATEHNVRVLDSVLPDLVHSGANRAANIYLVTSPQDEQYASQVEPYVRLFQGHENFNFVYNDSPLITDHGKVTLRNLPTLIGLLNLLVEGITPRFGMVRNGYEEPTRDTSAIDAYLTQTSLVQGDESFPGRWCSHRRRRSGSPRTPSGSRAPPWAPYASASGRTASTRDPRPSPRTVRGSGNAAAPGPRGGTSSGCSPPTRTTTRPSAPKWSSRPWRTRPRPCRSTSRRPRRCRGRRSASSCR